MRKLKNWAILVLGILPKSKVKNALLKIFGFKISNHVKIGINIFWNNGPITLGSESSIGNFNIFRNLKSMKLGSESRIGNFNWCTSNLEDLNATKACLILADGSIITSRHYIDCAGGVFLQENSGLLGVRSTVMTHGVDPKNRKQTYSTTIIGRNTLIDRKSTRLNSSH